LVDQTGGHDLEGEDLTLEVRTSSSRASTVFHVGTLKSRATEMVSKSGGKGLNIQDSGGTTVKTGTSDVTRESSSSTAKEILVHMSSKTKSMDKFMHHTYHALFVLKNIGSVRHESSTDSGSTRKRSVGSTGSGAGNGVSNI